MKNFVAWLLVCLMVLTSLPVAAFAAGEECPYKDNPGSHPIESGHPVQVVDPKCGEDGYTVYQCDTCDAKFVADIKLKPYDHVLDIKTPMVPTTCDTLGTAAVVYCKNEGCSIADGRAATAADEAALGVTLIPASVADTRTAHDANTEDTEVGDCVNGYTPAKKCATCNVTYTVGTATPGTNDHDWEYVRIVTVPTCTEAGAAVVHCKTCDKTYDNFKVNALGHNPGAVVEQKNASCKDTLVDGKKAHRVCERCEAYMDATNDQVVTEESLVIKAEHSYGTNPYVITGGSCNTEPTITRKCDTCAADIAQTVETYLKDNTDTYLTEGKFYVHDWAWTRHEDPTCGKVGYDLYICNECGETKTDVLAKIATHTKTLDAAKADGTATYTDPTCISDGYWEWECSGCCAEGEKAKEIDKDTMNDHAKDLVKVTINPTCKTEGFTFYYCPHEAACGKITAAQSTFTVGEKVYDLGGSYYVDSFDTANIVTPDDSLESKMHAWSTISHVAPTCLVPGVESKVCTLCGKEDMNRKLDATGHDMSADLGKKYQDYTMYEAGNENYGQGYACANEGCDVVTWDKAAAYAYPVAEHFNSYEDLLHFHENAPAADAAAWKAIYTGTPACTVKSIYQATCTCGVVVSYKSELAEHDYNGVDLETEKAPVNQSACDKNDAEDGWEFCSVCNTAESKKELKAELIAHTLVTVDDEDDDDSNNSKKATCNDYGWTTGKYCTTCADYELGVSVGYTEGGFKWLPAIAHKNAEYHEAAANTCYNDGNKAYYYCPDCKLYAESETAVEASALTTLTWVDEEAYKANIVIAKTNHVGTTKNISHSVTCLVDGYTIVHCSKCDEVIEIKDYVKAIGHTFTYTEDEDAEADTIFNANCTEGGYKIFNCNNPACTKEDGWQLKVDTDPALGHKNSKDETLTNDCTLVLEGGRVCVHEDCTDDDNVIEAKHETAKTTVAATCSTESYDLEYCTNGCAYHVVTNLGAKNPDAHTWKADENQDKIGVTKETCALCGLTREVPVTVSNVEYIIKAENAQVAGADFAQGSTIKVTLSIKSEYAKLNALHVTMNYDEELVDFLRADYGVEVNPNFALLPIAHGADGVVSYTALVEGNADYELLGEQVLAVFYFRIHGANYDKDEELFAVEAGSTTFAIDYETPNATEALNAAKQNAGITENEAITVDYTKLTDVNADGGLGVADIQTIIANLEKYGSCDSVDNGYLAAADVDMDGDVDIDDATIILYRVNNIQSDWDIFANICG